MHDHLMPSQRELFPPPQRFERVKELAWAEFSFLGPFQGKQPAPQTEAQKQGLRYERKCHEHFSTIFPGRYGGAQWIIFRERTSGKVRYAQPDGLIVDYTAGLIIILEMKIRHGDKAWWSLRYLYEPLFEYLFPSWRIACCEVVRWFDPSVPWPEAYRRVASPALLKPGEIGVHIWNP